MHCRVLMDRLALREMLEKTVLRETLVPQELLAPLVLLDLRFVQAHTHNLFCDIDSTMLADTLVFHFRVLLETTALREPADPVDLL